MVVMPAIYNTRSVTTQIVKTVRTQRKRVFQAHSKEIGRPHEKQRKGEISAGKIKMTFMMDKLIYKNKYMQRKRMKPIRAARGRP